MDDKCDFDCVSDNNQTSRALRNVMMDDGEDQDIQRRFRLLLALLFCWSWSQQPEGGSQGQLMLVGGWRASSIMVKAHPHNPTGD